MADNLDVEESRLLSEESRLLSNHEQTYTPASRRESTMMTSSGKYLGLIALATIAAVVVISGHIPGYNVITKASNFQMDPTVKAAILKASTAAAQPVVPASADIEEETTSANPSAQNGRVVMMSLVGATAESNFNQCSSTYKSGSFGNVRVSPGCISLFNSDIAANPGYSNMITFCGCETLGPKKYDFVALQNAGLISKKGSGLISFLATGDGASATIYNSADFGSDTNSFKTVIGPQNQIGMNRLVMGESTWDNNIYSIVMQAWTNCDLPPVPCTEITTNMPVTSPTHSPFVQPSAKPTIAPHTPPSKTPISTPTTIPTTKPRARPTMEPLSIPTLAPTMDPTKSPLAVPTHMPTENPLAEPSQFPTKEPINISPTLEPTQAPTMDPRIVICKEKLSVGSDIVPGKTYPSQGCVSFFWRDVKELDESYISTICSCDEVGQFQVTNDMMAKVGAARADGFPTISAIITGNKTSVTVYASGDLSGVDKYVLGPRETVDLKNVERKSGSGAWDDKVRSISLMSWPQCGQHVFKNTCFDI